MILLLSAGLFWNTGVSAGEISAVLNGKSYHVGSTEDWNENNYGLGFEYQFATTSRWKKRLHQFRSCTPTTRTKPSNCL